MHLIVLLNFVKSLYAVSMTIQRDSIGASLELNKLIEITLVHN